MTLDFVAPITISWLPDVITFMPSITYQGGWRTVGKAAVAVIEKGPVEMTQIGHQSPSNTGFFFAANAS